MMINKNFTAILLLAVAPNAQARNIVITADGIGIATSTNGGRSLVTYDANRSNERDHQFNNLPINVGGFDDVAVDPQSMAKDSTFVFAIDADSGRLCSFELSLRTQSVSLELIGCANQSVRSRPFVGIAAMGGTLIVSGGTGGVSVFRYNRTTGVLPNQATIRNVDLGDIGHPDVTLVTPRLAALATDADPRTEEASFGIAMANINLNRGRITRTRFFPVRDTIGFNYVIGPANFPCTSAVYNVDSGVSYLYVANGPLTVQNARNRRGIARVVSDIPNGFVALTVAVNSEMKVAVVGGVTDGGSNSAYLVLDISSPLNPVVVTERFLGNNNDSSGRVTSVASAGNDILYVRDGISRIGHDSLDVNGEIIISKTA